MQIAGLAILCREICSGIKTIYVASPTIVEPGKDDSGAGVFGLVLRNNVLA